MLYLYVMDDSRIAQIEAALGAELYSREALYDLIYRFCPTYSASSCNWIIGIMTQRKILFPIGKGFFRRPRKEWLPYLQDKDRRIVTRLCAEFPSANLSICGSSIINNLSMMVGGDDYLIVQIDKQNLFPCYMKLREISKTEVLISPTEHELNYYMKPNSIILVPLFSKSPCHSSGLVTLEKLIVDLLCDRLIARLYPRVSFDKSIKKLLCDFDVNLSTLSAYAKRRKCFDVVLPFLRETLPIESSLILEEN